MFFIWGTLGLVMCLLMFLRVLLFAIISSFLILMSNRDPRNTFLMVNETLLLWPRNMIRISRLLRTHHDLDVDAQQTEANQGVRWGVILKEFLYVSIYISILYILFPENFRESFIESVTWIKQTGVYNFVFQVLFADTKASTGVPLDGSQ